MKNKSNRGKILWMVFVGLLVACGYLFVQLKKREKKIKAFIPQAEKLIEENELLRRSLREQNALVQQYEIMLDSANRGFVKPQTHPVISVDSIFQVPDDLNFRDLNRP